MKRHVLCCSFLSVCLLATARGASIVPLATLRGVEQPVLSLTGNAPGLTALYFNNSTLAGKPVLRRQDTAPDFEWGQKSPDPAVSTDYFSVRWEGALMVATTGSYSFAVRPGEQVKLWVGGQKVLDTWDGKGQSHSEARVTLAAGETTSLKLEYHSEEGNAHVQLQWTPPGQERQPIPARSFTSDGGAVAVATATGSPKPSASAGKQKAATPAATRPAKPASVAAKPVAPKPVASTKPAPAELSGVYMLKARATGHPLVVADERQPGNPDTTAAPQWRIEPAGQGYYRVLVQGGTKVLEVLGSSSSNGASLDLWPYYSGNNQLWQIKEMEGGYYSLVAKHSRKALTARAPAEGGLQQWRYTGREDQQWKLEPVAAAAAGPMAAADTPLVGNGLYDVNVYPNPSNGVSQLRYQLPENLPVGWVLYDTRGVVVRTSDYRRATSGVHQQTLPLTALPTGDYQLHLTVGTITTTQPILIRHPAAEQAQAK